MNLTITDTDIYQAIIEMQLDGETEKVKFAWRKMTKAQKRGFIIWLPLNNKGRSRIIIEIMQDIILNEAI